MIRGASGLLYSLPIMEMKAATKKSPAASPKDAPRPSLTRVTQLMWRLAAHRRRKVAPKTFQLKNTRRNKHNKADCKKRKIIKRKRNK